MVAAPKYRSPVLRTVWLYQVSLLATFWNKALCDTWEDLRAANLQEGRLSDSQPSLIFLSGSIAAHCQEGTLLFLPWSDLPLMKDSFIKLILSRKHLLKVANICPKRLFFWFTWRLEKSDWNSLKLAGAALAWIHVAFLNFSASSSHFFSLTSPSWDVSQSSDIPGESRQGSHVLGLGFLH